jgi:hypothetical protein
MRDDLINPALGLGFCQCGCGNRTKIAPMTNRARGYVKGEPYRYCDGHYRRSPRRHYIVDGQSGCWLWQGKLQHNGYGRTRVDGRVMYAHRAFYEMDRGPIPPGLVLDHLCRNRACVNPDHLQAVSYSVNNRRGGATKLTPEAAREIREILLGLAAKHGVSVRTLCNVAAGHTWRDT